MTVSITNEVPPRPVAGGFIITVEFTDAYTDGSSRFQEFFVPRENVFDSAGNMNARTVRQAAVLAIIEERPFDDLIGTDLRRSPVPTVGR